jgi:hypothetical protein
MRACADAHVREYPRRGQRRRDPPERFGTCANTRITDERF